MSPDELSVHIGQCAGNGLLQVLPRLELTGRERLIHFKFNAQVHPAAQPPPQISRESIGIPALSSTPFINTLQMVANAILSSGTMRSPIFSPSFATATRVPAHNRALNTGAIVNNALENAAHGPLKGILEYCDEPLVSSDFKGNPASSIVDSLSTMIADGNMIKILSWYDNEWGYCARTADVAAYIASKGL